MSVVTQELSQAIAIAFTQPGKTLRHMRRAFRSALVRLRTRRIIAGLSEAQLRDTGIDRSAVLGNKPAFKADTRRDTYLMSLR